jgi:hypothetical protein
MPTGWCTMALVGGQHEVILKFLQFKKRTRVKGRGERGSDLLIAILPSLNRNLCLRAMSKED